MVRVARDYHGLLEYSVRKVMLRNRLLRGALIGIFLVVTVAITDNFGMARGNRSLNQADHREVGLAVIDAARDAGNRWIFPELLDEGFEPWNGIKMICVSGSSDATHAIDVTDFIDKGVESLQEHRVYIDNLGSSFDPDMFLRMNLNAIGERFGCDYAVSFEIFNI